MQHWFEIISQPNIIKRNPFDRNRFHFDQVKMSDFRDCGIILLHKLKLS